MSDTINYAKDRARWGFGGTASEITIGVEKSGEIGLIEKGEYKPSSDDGAVRNGGGDGEIGAAAEAKQKSNPKSKE